MRKIDVAPMIGGPGGDHLRQSDNHGTDMTDADPKERNVAMLFKNSVLYPGMSVEDNLTFSSQNDKDAGCRDREKSG
ncbi:MAG: hypothetical protein ACLR78_03980 [Roseburia sp.]